MIIFDSKKINIFHKINVIINDRNYFLYTDFDVCEGDVCSINYSEKNEDIIKICEIISVSRVSDNVVPSDKILSVQFECDENEIRKYNLYDKYLYEITLNNDDNKDEQVYFTSISELEKGDLVLGESCYGIIERKLEFDSSIIAYRTIYAYKNINDSLSKYYVNGIPPRYLLSELKKKYIYITNLTSKTDDINCNEFIYVDDYHFESEQNEILDYLILNGRFKDKNSANILTLYYERINDNNKLTYWNQKI